VDPPLGPSVQTLPLFPLSLVLFPGTTMPLHIFEPRYRRLLADCLAGDQRFGLIYLPESTAERELPPGHVGCVAHVDSAEEMPDGRSNIVVSGGERFAVERFLDSPLPYAVAAVTAHEDIEEPTDRLEALATDLRVLFVRVARAAHILTDDRAPIPDLPNEPAMVAFRVASLIDIDLPMRQGVLTSRSPSLRIQEVQRVLDEALAPLERRASMHLRAKTNGSGIGSASGTST